MTNIRPLLDKVWSELRQASVVDDIDIIEYVAALLTEDEQWQLAEELKPHKLRAYNPGDAVKTLLIEQAAEQISEPGSGRKKGILFDRHVLFHSSKFSERGSYPTPRHIVDFMLTLLQVKPEDAFADFACGSGGFLVHRYARKSIIQKGSNGQTVGIEISPNWAHIAAANIALNGIADGNIHLYVGDAFRICGTGGELEQRTFDCISMCPPLDIRLKPLKEDVTSARMTLGGRTSDLAFTQLLLQKLKPSGRGVITVSDTFFAEERTGSYEVRKSLIENHELRTIITFKATVLAPFSNHAVHLLRFRKTVRAQGEKIWFFIIERDGYAQGRNRNLGENPSTEPEDNDMPFARWAVSLTGNEKEFIKIGNNNGLLCMRIVRGKKLLGVVVKALRRVIIRTITYIEKADVTYLAIEAEARTSAQSLSPASLIHATIPLKGRENDLPIEFDGKTLFQYADPGQLIAISYDGRLLGVTQTPKEIAKLDYSLLPEKYLQNRDGHRWIPPGEASMEPHLNEGNTLASILPPGLEREILVANSASQPLPSLPRLSMPNLPQVLNVLGSTQQQIWERIKRLDPTNTYALYFTAEQLADEHDLAEVYSALYLLERLGLVVRVAVRHNNAARATTCYRRVTDRESKIREEDTSGDPIQDDK